MAPPRAPRAGAVPPHPRRTPPRQPLRLPAPSRCRQGLKEPGFRPPPWNRTARPLPTRPSAHLCIYPHPSVCSASHPSAPHPLLSRPAIPPPILQALIVHAFIHLSPHPPLAHPPSHPFATPPPPITHPLRTHSPVLRPSLTRPFPHSLVPDTFLEPSRSGCLRHVDAAGPLPSHCL